MTKVSPVNVWWAEARRQSLEIEKVGKAYVAIDGADRQRVFWHNNETREALTWLNSVSAKEQKVSKPAPKSTRAMAEDIVETFTNEEVKEAAIQGIQAKYKQNPKLMERDQKLLKDHYA